MNFLLFDNDFWVSESQILGFRPGKKILESVLVNYIGPQQVRSSTGEAMLKKIWKQLYVLAHVVLSLAFCRLQEELGGIQNILCRNSKIWRLSFQAILLLGMTVIVGTAMFSITKLSRGLVVPEILSLHYSLP